MGVAWRRWGTEVKVTSYDSNTPLEELVAIQSISHELTPQTWENGRKSSRIEIQQLSRRSRKKGGVAIDDETIRIENSLKEVVDRLLQDKPEGTQPLEVHEEAYRLNHRPKLSSPEALVARSHCYNSSLPLRNSSLPLFTTVVVAGLLSTSRYSPPPIVGILFALVVVCYKTSFHLFYEHLNAQFRNDFCKPLRHALFLLLLIGNANGVGWLCGRIQWLAHGPRKHVTSYTRYIVNGYWFHTIDVGRSTQDSGVSFEADTIYQSNANDKPHTIGRLYYGVIRDIILLDYYSFKVPVFRYDWVNLGTGIKIEDDFTLVNLHQGLKTFESDPFILASQAKQVFYSKDNDESNWYVLLKALSRGIYNMNVLEEDAYTSSTPLDVSQLEINITEKEPYSTNECEGIDVIET
ncbi:hypothetical protein ZIOFF_070324 [Zingiber officinale]|uniref:DUF4216 domain-containing protein n=1 Tax=Zingiber officinale TaxID=94328 RepID=A0A8J5BIP1_ZINOF|nr:hypothetical protein ZIOFF_070324 [Zingiber officinale]